MGRLFLIDLEGNFYSCKHCNTPLALADDVISKSFYWRRGKAYLFNNVVNVTFGHKHWWLMITGWHTIVEILCVKCGTNVGWKYFREDSSFKPQVGRLAENDMYYDTDEKLMATLRRHLRLAREGYYRHNSIRRWTSQRLKFHRVSYCCVDALWSGVLC